MEYAISSSNGDSIRIAASNWMVGFGKAVACLGIDLDAVALRCTPTGEQVVEVIEIGRSRSWTVT